MTFDGSTALTIQFFSVLRELLDRRTTEMMLDQPESVGTVLNRLVAHHPEMAPFRSSLRVAVNLEYVGEEYTVFNGDEIAIITPVSGG